MPDAPLDPPLREKQIKYDVAILNIYNTGPPPLFEVIGTLDLESEF